MPTEEKIEATEVKENKQPKAKQPKLGVQDDGITVAVPRVNKTDNRPRVRVFIPLADNAESGDIVDPFEHVTINGETTYIRKGEYVDVTVPVYMQLKNKYPNI